MERLIAESLVSHTHVQAQSALLASSQAGVESPRWPFYPTQSISVESAKSTHAKGGDQGAFSAFAYNNLYSTAIARLDQGLGRPVDERELLALDARAPLVNQSTRSHQQPHHLAVPHQAVPKAFGVALNEP